MPISSITLLYHVTTVFQLVAYSQVEVLEREEEDDETVQMGNEDLVAWMREHKKGGPAWLYLQL